MLSASFFDFLKQDEGTDTRIIHYFSCSVTINQTNGVETDTIAARSRLPSDLARLVYR